MLKFSLPFLLFSICVFNCAIADEALNKHILTAIETKNYIKNVSHKSDYRVGVIGDFQVDTVSSKLANSIVKLNAGEDLTAFDLIVVIDFDMAKSFDLPKTAKSDVILIGINNACVVDGVCVLGIEERGSSFDILLNQEASEKRNVFFDGTFLFTTKRV
ncbi:hypothetical protein C7B61_00100 [filamentous cyanobacterium CCP1]|nr:hypothetical protein C7B61_00100 [filamentous cyanobacterium CCP1]